MYIPLCELGEGLAGTVAANVKVRDKILRDICLLGIFTEYLIGIIYNKVAYEMMINNHLHMPSYFLGAFTEYPPLFNLDFFLHVYLFSLRVIEHIL